MNLEYVDLLAVAGLIAVCYVTVNALHLKRWSSGRMLGGEETDVGAEPSVALLFAARNEQERIASTVESLLAQEYGNLRIVVVDDRSDDATGSIVERIGAHAIRFSGRDILEVSRFLEFMGKYSAELTP